MTQARLSFFDQKTIHLSRGIKIKLFQIHSRRGCVNWFNAHKQQQKERRESSFSLSLSRWFRAIFFFALNKHALRFIYT